MSSLERWLGLADEEAREAVLDGAPPLSDFFGHLSASSIGMLFRCPRQFRHRYILGEKERPGEKIVIGSFFHEALDWNYRQKIASHQDEPVVDAVQYLQDVAVPKVVEKEGGADWIAWDTPQGLDAARRDSERILTAYYNTVVPRIQPTQTEDRFEITVPGVEVPVIGYIDVQDEQRVVDTKTGKQVSRKIKPSWQLQGRLYAHARRKPVEFHSVSRAQTPSICTPLESEAMIVPVPNEQATEALTRLVNTAADQIRHFLMTLGPDEEWPQWGAIPDWSRNVLPCDMCGWRQGCPMWS